MNKLLVVLSVLFLAGCNSPDSEKKAEEPSKGEPAPLPEMPQPGKILGNYYHDYFVALGESRTNKVQTVATFRKGGLYGKVEKLPSSYSVFFDDKEVPASKEYFNYSADLNPEGFEGQHEWKILEDNVAVFSESFSFKKFTTTSTIPSTIGNKDIPVTINGLSDGDSVTVRIYNIDIENDKDWFTYPVANNAITILSSDIKTLKSGTYKMRLEWRVFKPVMIANKKAGRLEIAYLFDDRDVKVNY